jgi:hypothetical protein
MGELGHQLATGRAAVHVHGHAAHGSAARLAFGPQFTQPDDAGLRAGAPGFHPFSDPDLFLRQQLVGLGLDHGFLRQLFFFLDLVGTEIAGVGAQLSPVELDDARGHAVQEGAVVGDGHHAALEVDQQLLQPLDRVQVQVVGGFVEQQDIGLAHQRLGECDAFAGSAGQRADLRLWIQMQAMQGLLDALLPVPAVLRLNRALQGIEVALTVRVLFDQLDQSLEACAHRSEHGVVRVQQRFLGDKRQAHALLELDHSVVRFLHASQDLEQRGLSRAVASDEADALATLQREAGLVEKCHVAEGQMGVNECDQCHVSADYPACISPARPACTAEDRLRAGAGSLIRGGRMGWMGGQKLMFGRVHARLRPPAVGRRPLAQATK